MLCRNTQDCTWMDPSMHCEDYELDFNINRGWYGGDYLAVVGECECDTWSRWDNWDLQCEFSFFASKESHIVFYAAGCDIYYFSDWDHLHYSLPGLALSLLWLLCCRRLLDVQKKMKSNSNAFLTRTMDLKC